MPYRVRRPVTATAQTKLAQARVRRGVTQEEMADATGISTATYWRLEHGRLSDPSIRLLANCALALGVEVEELIEDEWREWLVLDQRRPHPPDAASFWRKQ
ncbi:MAG: helix-turn-helix transcriptional regulator [Solirubrobacteraceae bacterium]|jgi:transcriptional regulator with XRE-family HTH domain